MSAEKPYRDESTLRFLYWERGLTLAEVGERLGCTDMGVRYWMNQHKIERRPRGEKPPAPTRPWRDEETLRYLYWGRGLTLAEVGGRLGCSEEAIREAMAWYEIPRRTPGGEAT